MHRKARTYLGSLGFILRNDQQQFLQDTPERSQRLGEFPTRKESIGFCQCRLFDIVVAERNGWKDFPHLGRLGVPTDIED